MYDRYELSGACSSFLNDGETEDINPKQDQDRDESISGRLGRRYSDLFGSRERTNLGSVKAIRFVNLGIGGFL